MNIWLDEDSGLDEGAKAILSRAADLCLKAEDIGEPDRFALSLTLVDEEEIRQINRDFRGIDRVTDVLSFPQFETADEAREAAEKAALSGVEIPEEGEEIPLGDVVICREQIRRQAGEYGHSEKRELVYLFVHSVLHLLGYDHMEEEDRKEMRAREEGTMASLGISREEE
ncbi:MAG: rRNA maturation RNase YbeY [Firmicutes bacterium]|nr:rRNA maturation RNase YbeY [Bacillota bacterium]